MATSTDIATIRVQRYLNMPLVQRCNELAMLIDESSTTELQHVFPMIIDSLFGITDNIGWGLHCITYKKNPQEYEILYNFLSPLGPIFSLCYKLLPDCYLKYNFPVSYLPSKIRSMLEEGVIPPFYLDKIRDDQGARVPSALCMTHYYLHHFLPRDNSIVLPIIGPYIKKSPQRKLMHMPESKRLQTPRLLRTSILSPGSTNLVVGVPQQQCLPQVWRSETVIQVFLDFWMEYTEDDHMPSQMNMSYSTPIPRRHSIHSGEHIRLVRAFIKTLHEFANSSVGDKSAMDELKRIILPSVQGKIYIFLRKAIYHWPLDSSFRLILEAWLSFIQPWRYVPGVTYTKEGRPEEEERGKIHDPKRWIAFIANNLLAYTVIFQQLLPRFMRTDLIAPKDALMLFRVTKVFSQPHLARILSEIESCMDDANLNRSRMQSSQWTSIVRQQIMELEGPTYQYVPMFSVAIITQITFFLGIIKQAHLTATSLIEALEKRKRSQQYLVAIWEFFYGEDNSSDDISIEERRRVPLFLANAQQQLIEIFEISIEDIPQISITPDQEYHDSILSTSFHHQHQMDSSLDSSRPGLFVPIPDGGTNFRYIEYIGDPELQPVRSNECTFLVRYLYKFCTYINNKYQHEINNLYKKRNFLGRICRQILIPPTTVVKLPKRTTNGFTSGHEELLPPRLSLRRLSNYNFLAYLLVNVSIAGITNYGILWLFFITFIIWSTYILIRAVFEPCFKSRESINTFKQNTTTSYR
ncbi:hypothetical protein M0802_002076 [Mischocyttarus mexicanus]|nr:hypothetical protein M0802_002076 [Mischocyttarus mexicanus]